MASNTSECALIIEGSYDRALHIGSIFIIFGASLAGVLLPLGLNYFSHGNKSYATTLHGLLQLAKMFGAGVLLSTAFVHMLVPATEAFSNTACLPKLFSDYGAMARLLMFYIGAQLLIVGAFTAGLAVLAIALIMFIQFLARTFILGNNGPQHVQSLVSQEKKAYGSKEIDLDLEAQKKPTAAYDPCHHSHELEHLARQERHVAVYMLELSVAIHSVIIGLALGVAREGFETLLAALVFHQFFEGLALSSVLIEASFRSWVPGLVVVCVYSLSTPVGTAIGVGIHDTYNENARSTLLSIGTLEALCAGILIYDSLVNILQPHLLSPAFARLSKTVQVSHFMLFWLGAGVMTFIGKYA